MDEWQTKVPTAFLKEELSEIRSSLWEESQIAEGILNHVRRKSIDKLPQTTVSRTNCLYQFLSLELLIECFV